MIFWDIFFYCTFTKKLFFLFFWEVERAHFNICTFFFKSTWRYCSCHQFFWANVLPLDLLSFFTWNPSWFQMSSLLKNWLILVHKRMDLFKLAGAVYWKALVSNKLHSLARRFWDPLTFLLVSGLSISMHLSTYIIFKTKFNSCFLLVQNISCYCGSRWPSWEDM